MDELEACRHRGIRAPGRRERRPARSPGRPDRRGRRPRGHPDGRPDLSVVCFRHLPGGATNATAIEAADPGALDRYTDRLAALPQHSGEGWLSTIVLRGRTYLRAGIVNALSSSAAADDVLAALRRLSPDAARAAGLPELD